MGKGLTENTLTTAYAIHGFVPLNHCMSNKKAVLSQGNRAMPMHRVQAVVCFI